MFGIKSKEEKEKGRLLKQVNKKKIFNNFKSLLESDTIAIVDELKQDYLLIFSVYNKNETSAKNYLIQELQELLDEFNDDISLVDNYINTNAGKYYNKNCNSLRNHLIKGALNTPVTISTENFYKVLENNIDNIINNKSVFQEYFDEIQNKEIEEMDAITLDYLMAIPILIVSIFTKIQVYENFFNQNIDSENKDLLTILKNISEANIESKQVIENVSNIITYLYSTEPKLSEFDIYIYILAIRENILIKEHDLLIPKSMDNQTSILIDNLKLVNNDSDKKKNKNDIEALIKEYIESYIPKSFVQTDKYMLQYFDYYICTLLLQLELITLNDAISYLIKGFITKDYEETYFNKKAIWDNERYVINDFSIELQELSLLEKYENVQNGYEFEEFCFSLYSSLGYSVEHTTLSNDQGADLIIEKDGIRTVVQAKHYAFPVGNKAVQEVVAAKAFYDNAHNAIVITNSTYTPSAIKLAEANSVELVDGDTIREYIEQVKLQA